MKVLLADDEYLIREGLRDNVPWAAHGMEVIATAEDGTGAGTGAAIPAGSFNHRHLYAVYGWVRIGGKCIAGAGGYLRDIADLL